MGSLFFFCTNKEEQRGNSQRNQRGLERNFRSNVAMHAVKVAAALVVLVGLHASGSSASRADPWEGDVDTVLLDRSNFTRCRRLSLLCASRVRRR